jgi:cytochrome bd-type quinol oxidase subunit 2
VPVLLSGLQKPHEYQLIDKMMENLGTIHKFNFIIGVILIIIVFSIAFAYLKPHRLHKTRATSTLLLKGSYLLYLLVLMIILYLSVLVKGGIDKVFGDIEFFAFLIVLFVPTMGILARKLAQFNKKRDNFNYFVTVVNALSIIALLVMFFI